METTKRADQEKAIIAVLESLRNSQTTVDTSTGHQAVKALGVMVLTTHIREYLECNDPQALRQAIAAILELAPHGVSATVLA